MQDKTLRFILIWIAVMLTVLAVDRLFQTPVLLAQSSKGLGEEGPVEVIIKEPIRVNIVKWSGYPHQAIRVKIDDPWPAKIEVEDAVEVKGELKLRK